LLEDGQECAKVEAWLRDVETYKMNIKNGGASVALALDGEEEAPGNNALPSRPRGHKATKALSSMMLQDYH
jgi:hypothetical protein